ncbi:ribonuclease D [uncultured Bartonella sp.]|uniref:ribonuclease D n=1 Tax=uncultured Bartonella sp. TaxID=104108 RepID=UPI002630F0D5|nr:ribonuclease D [uncultured Bartonella sp.]
MKPVTDTKTLENVVSTVSKSDFVTIDTEFIRESTYWPQLCLIQLASPDIAVIIDPMSPELDLAPLFDLMVNKDVEKVFHAARQDIEIIYKLGKVIPTPLFDTQVAGAVCGFGESVSYEQIVERVTGATIDKSSRYTDWSRRPLSEKQLAYALADVTHLREVYKYLRNELEQSGRTHWIDDEMSILTSTRTYEMPNDEAWKRIKGRIRKPRELAVLQKVAGWRESQAKKRNVPRGRILKDECLIEVAVQQPKDETSLARLRSIPKGWERSALAADLLNAVNMGLGVAVGDLPAVDKHVAVSKGTAAAIELLRVLLKLVADEENIAPRIIANNDDLEKIAKRAPHSDIAALQGWRYQIFGEKAEKMLNGRLGFYFQNGKILTKELA